MFKRIVYAVACITPMAFSSHVAAAALDAETPYFTTVGDRQAVIYYVARAEGDEVVVTIAAQSPDSGASLRSVAMLQPGQRYTLSLGGAAGTPPATLEIARDGDAVSVHPSALQHQAAN